MNKPTLVLPLIKSGITSSFKICILIAIITGIATFYLSLNKDVINILWLYLSFGLFIISLTAMNLIKSYNVESKLLFFNDYLLFKKNSREIKIDFSDIEKIDFLAKEFKGQTPSPPPFSSVLFDEEGVNNWIRITSKKREIYKYEFLLTEENIKKLRNQINHLKQNQDNIKVSAKFNLK